MHHWHSSPIGILTFSVTQPRVKMPKFLLFFVLLQVNPTRTLPIPGPLRCWPRSPTSTRPPPRGHSSSSGELPSCPQTLEIKQSWTIRVQRSASNWRLEVEQKTSPWKSLTWGRICRNWGPWRKLWSACYERWVSRSQPSFSMIKGLKIHWSINFKKLGIVDRRIMRL